MPQITPQIHARQKELLISLHDLHTFVESRVPVIRLRRRTRDPVAFDGWKLARIATGRAIAMMMIVLSATGAGGCFRADSPPVPEAATVRLANSTLELSIEREPMHVILAEYHRTAVLRDGARMLVRQPMFDDTGGYSRTNLYGQGDSTLVLVDAEGSYTLHPARRELYKDGERRSDAASRGAFMGAFDIDSSQVWRFITARERRELPVAFHGGDG